MMGFLPQCSSAFPVQGNSSLCVSLSYAYDCSRIQKTFSGSYVHKPDRQSNWNYGKAAEQTDKEHVPRLEPTTPFV